MGLEQRRDRAQEVRLANTWRTADEQRVVCVRWHLCDRKRGCVRETVAIADHELLERELWVPARRGAEGRSGLVRPALARVAVPHAVVAVSRGYELHDRAGTGHGREGLLQDAAEALCDPALRVLRCLDYQTPRAQLARAQSRQPDAVRGLPDRESELGL